ncbi:hypothetical protein [Methylobacterium nonmethylotrophicum]|uniref:Uncharacterized protein n=1 Tax=Methylobacterium nonmethylotrophicum TaxID=1141884 RepID=A0A4Z0NM27_9HYPH|nr:hypothetical protein [Methylobacterium nonmethylotrophicum]TGD96887.1 hypothetical protein EU555_21095 [Methylobacterium nonmethylotrophicum]
MGRGPRRPEKRFQGIAMQAEIPMRRVTAIRCYPSGERDHPDQRVLNVLECGHVVSFEGMYAVAALLAKRQLCLKCAEEAKAAEPPPAA